MKYPRYNEQEVAFRWRVDWWDGPINGSISYRSARYWFEFYCDTDEPGGSYYYLVYPLSNEEADFADSWSAENERFRDKWMPLANSPATKDSIATADIAAKWKTHEERLPDYTGRGPVAWFLSGTNPDFYAIHVYRKALENSDRPP